VHFHCVVIEGVFEADGAGGARLHEAWGVDAETVAEVQSKVRRRVLRALARRGGWLRPYSVAETPTGRLQGAAGKLAVSRRARLALRAREELPARQRPEQTDTMDAVRAIHAAQLARQATR
jgi:hypothetical protein